MITEKMIDAGLSEWNRQRYHDAFSGDMSVDADKRRMGKAYEAMSGADDRKCIWSGDDDGYDYSSGCGHYFALAPDADTPDQWMECCCYCGNPFEMALLAEDSSNAEISQG